MGSEDKVRTRSTAELEKEEAVVFKVVEKLLNSQSFMEKLTQVIDSNINNLIENKLKSYEDKITRLEQELASVKSQMNDSVDKLEQYSRLNNLRIFGIEEKPGENTDQVIVNICKDKLGVDISLKDIDCSHRLPAKEPQHKPIIVKFISRNIKTLIYNNKKKLKNTKIVIREDLTRRRAQLLKEAASRCGVNNVWTRNGNIKIKINSKINGINTKMDLDRLLSNS